ncbi:hypothetical protein [Salinarchaeum sp. Harcht-Bsk1]|uniref:hypothetical protein n=1 Tax=Salinarchaeum sp. Harcht-Bsk1 TaxID=1333523 RepID=UPI0009DB8134|nr:hypothetical protein [Salinarchaeum sp. Harcht-Bsk1]
MEKTAKLEYGPLEVEIHALDDEDYQKEILDLIQFIEENQDSLEGLGGGIEASGMPDSESDSMSLEEFGDDGGEQAEEVADTSGPLGEIASRLRVPEARLEEFVYVDPDGGDFPVLYLDEVSNISERKTDRQRIASLILLYVWHECYDESRVKSSSLKDALELSNVSSSGMGNMYQGDGDRYFDRSGRGPSATVSLTPPGKRQARKVLKRLMEEGSKELE